MIRKILAISLSVIYLTITIGFPISIHHCNGHNKLTLSMVNEPSCSSCIVETDNSKSCCGNEKGNLQNSHHNLQESDCCTHETKVILFDFEQQLAQKEEFKVQIVEIELFDSQLLFDSESVDLVDNSNIEFRSKPPSNTIPLQIINQQFVFYG